MDSLLRLQIPVIVVTVVMHHGRIMSPKRSLIGDGELCMAPLKMERQLSKTIIIKQLRIAITEDALRVVNKVSRKLKCFQMTLMV